ncbi:MAG: hypothetical protein IPI35_13200 [Deltaproteobacteria bacterium]|nr:hypothetical protein [Deltaproteobacteria bacterium]
MIFFIDTNMLYEPKKLNELARVCERAHHEVVMSALVLAERLNQVRRRAKTFSRRRAGLKQLIARVIPLMTKRLPVPPTRSLTRRDPHAVR